MTPKPHTLVDADITVRPSVTRRSLLHALGVGAGVAAVAAFGGSVRAQQSPKRRDPCRDQDHGPSDQDGCGRPPIS
jgi:hypothetical protein